MDLERRYAAIFQQLQTAKDFDLESLETSRSLFDLTAECPIPRQFEVWTCLAGLPLPDPLTAQLEVVAAELFSLLPPGTRFYAVKPQLYHWELFIIKRPAETLDDRQLREAGERLGRVLRGTPPIALRYRGVLVTPDGTAIVRGFGEFDRLREQLRTAIPFASPHQSRLGHISLGRILDPIGEMAFKQLQDFVTDALDRDYGTFYITQAHYVHERRWYMEACETIRTLPFAGSR